MPRKKKKDPALTLLQMKTLDLFEARILTQQVVDENLRLKSDALSTQYRVQMAALKARIRATNESRQVIKDEHNKFIADIEKDLGIVLKDFSIEPDGYLTYNPLPEETDSEDVG